MIEVTILMLFTLVFLRVAEFILWPWTTIALIAWAMVVFDLTVMIAEAVTNEED